MRQNLKQARIDKGMTQQQIADYLHISLDNYKSIEIGRRSGNFELWDDLEDLFSIHQRILRQNTD